MARFLTLTNSKRKKRGVRKKALSGLSSPGPVTMIIGLVVLFCIVSLLFLTQAFQSSTKGYEVSALEDKIDELAEENKKLEIKAAEMQSLDSIENAVQQVNMIPVDNIVYLEHPQSSIVASNN